MSNNARIISGPSLKVDNAFYCFVCIHDYNGLQTFGAHDVIGLGSYNGS